MSHSCAGLAFKLESEGFNEVCKLIWIAVSIAYGLFYLSPGSYNLTPIQHREFRYQTYEIIAV